MSGQEGKLRLDVVLVARGLASGREKAKELITAGNVQVDGHIICKASFLVGEKARIVCDNSAQRYVGRGGYKLEKALDTWKIDLHGVEALDIGASTGGFTDCMVRHGASKVYAVDVGHGQLHASLRADPRVCVLEGMDIRKSEELLRFVAENSVLFCTIDVSFISVKAIFSAVTRFLKENATVICLVKPQFEAGRQAVGKNGVVRDPKTHRLVLREMVAFFAERGWPVAALTYSPITGGDGNMEYLALLRREACAFPLAVDAVVREAWETLGSGRKGK